MINQVTNTLSQVNPLYIALPLALLFLGFIAVFVSRFVSLKKVDDRPPAVRRLDKATEDITERLKNGDLSTQSEIPDKLKEAASYANDEEYEKADEKIDYLEEKLGESYEPGPSEKRIF